MIKVSESNDSNVRPTHIKEVKTSWIEKIHELNQKKNKVPTKIQRDTIKSRKENIDEEKIKNISTINDNDAEGEIHRLSFVCKMNNQNH